jgi:AcrR family transcriptional regulator
MARLRRIEGNATAERLIDVTLDLIDERGSSRGVNLREIAKRAGCAHTNAYNYFNSLEELFWYALAWLLKRMERYMVEKVGLVYDSDQYFEKFILSQIDFAFEHPGWYRFIWLEHISGSPPRVVMRYWEKIQADFVLVIFALSRKKLSQTQCVSVAQIIRGYIHGEVCSMLSGKKYKGERVQLQRNIIENAQTLLQALIAYF